ncbi:MAG: hypothetical protein INH41_05450 [Myxococcaceae bacterium]|jgi:hypothetical protein|nr:hypothetical protein [Myxococcaceae bacterium]MCA3011830.1 hypothetical protein [Myxococcaceae bacterium]
MAERPPPPFELFHAIADPSSARVRRWVVDHDYGEHVRFRNVSYPEVQADLSARGGAEVPALWDGRGLVAGADAVIARLRAHADVGRAG